MSNQWKGRGGARSRAGSPSQWKHPGTTTVRLPVLFVEQLKVLAKAVDVSYDPIATINDMTDFLAFPPALQQGLLSFGKQIEADTADSMSLIKEAIAYVIERQGF